MRYGRCSLLSTAALLSALSLARVAPAATAASSDLQRGAEIYTRCIACHSIERNRTGPLHCGLFGRKAGTAAGYDNYSKAMRDSDIVWNDHSLDKFLQEPLRALPGTYMGYAGIRDPAERAALIEWLRDSTRPGVSCHAGR